MKKNTKLFIFFLIIITVVLVIYQLFSTSQPSTVPTPSPTLENVLQFPAEPITTQPTRVIFRFPSNLPTTPSSLPAYPTDYTLTQDNAINLAQTMGFAGNPVIDPNYPNRLTWNNSSNSRLIIITSPVSVSLFNNPQLVSPSPEVTIAEQVVSSYLSQIGFSTPGLTLSVQDSGYLFVEAEDPHTQVTTDPTQASLTQLSLLYYLNGYPVYLEPKSPTSITAKITGNNQIVSLSLSYPPILGAPTNSPIIDSYLAATALQNERGSLVNATYHSLDQASQELSFSSVDVNTIDLIYTLDENINFLVPTYRFIGQAQLENNPNSPPVTVTYLVSAIPTTP